MRIEEKKNIRKAGIYIVSAVVVLVSFVIYGIPLLAKMAIFVGGLTRNEQTDAGDVTPPAPPKLAPVEGFVKTDKLSIRGFTEAGVDVKLYLNDSNAGKILADDSGEFLFPEVKIASGSSEIYVISTDKSGNSSQPSGRLKVTLDTMAPKLTINSPKEKDIISGSDKRSLKVTGETEENVIVKVNGRNAIVASGGIFETTITLADGDQEIKVEATDKAGNKTEKTVNVTYKP